MSKKAKSPVRRDEDFEQLDQELETAMRALESVNERTVDVLQRVDQGADVLGTDGASEPADQAASDAPTGPEAEPPGMDPEPAPAAER